MSSLALIAIAIGNSRTHVALFHGGELEEVAHIENKDHVETVYQGDDLFRRRPCKEASSGVRY